MLETIGCPTGKTAGQERKKQYDEWMGKIDQLVVPMGKNEKIKDAIKPLRDYVELVYGDKMR